MKSYTDFLIEAKVDKIIASRSNKSPLETARDIEDVRNVRAFGTSSNRNRSTGMRRLTHEWDRLPKDKELPTGNHPTTLNPKYDSRVGVRKQLRAAKKRREGRDFAKEVRIRREAENYIRNANSQFAADNAENKIVRFKEQKTYFQFQEDVNQTDIQSIRQSGQAKLRSLRAQLSSTTDSELRQIIRLKIKQLTQELSQRDEPTLSTDLEESSRNIQRREQLRQLERDVRSIQDTPLERQRERERRARERQAEQRQQALQRLQSQRTIRPS